MAELYKRYKNEKYSWISQANNKIPKTNRSLT